MINDALTQTTSTTTIGRQRTYHGLSMIQPNTPGQTSLRQKPEMGNRELVEL